MFEIGNTLREARLRRGLNVMECEAGTRIRAKYLRAIEEEHFDVLPSPAYVRGFLTTYADYLGLDGQLFMDEYESRFGVGSEMERRVERSARARARSGSGNRRRGRASRKGISTEAKLGWVGVGGLLILMVVMLQGMGDAPAPRSPFTSSSPAPVESLASSAEAPESVKVVMAGVGEYGSSIEVRKRSATGEQVFIGMLPPGAEQAVVMDGPLWMRSYNPAGLTVSIKGATRTLSGEAGDFIISRTGVKRVGVNAP